MATEIQRPDLAAMVKQAYADAQQDRDNFLFSQAAEYKEFRERLNTDTRELFQQAINEGLSRSAILRTTRMNWYTFKEIMGLKEKEEEAW